MTNIHIDDEYIWRKKFGDKLKRLIHIRDTTQNRVAYELGVDSSVISRYITGEQSPGSYRVAQIAYLLDCDLNWLFDVDN